MQNGISHCYELDESISNFRVAGWYFSLLLNFLKENSVCKQPDQTPRFTASDLVLFAKVPQKGHRAYMS